MDQELLKRYTDCVYFLASPLTCKKGLECEYRHSEIARINPRDCWYWLAGSCLNPNCAFRHPPLDGHIEASSESSLPQYDSTILVNRTNVPCYFYFNGFCNKGERCSFMHGPDDGTLACKSAQTASTVNDAAVVDKKMATRSDTGLTPIETQINTSETAIKGSTEPQSKAKEDFHQFAPSNVPENSASPHTSDSECEEAALVQSERLPPAEGFFESRSLVCTDQSSEDQVDCHLEREEWLESSPGFDVIVDDRLEDMVYEDDPEYVPALDVERRELNSQFLGYDYENPVGYDPAYPDAGNFYEQILHDSYDHLDDKHNSDYTRRTPGQSRERVFDRLSQQKRKFSGMELACNDSSMDLRDHLKRRRLVDGHSVTHFSKRHYSSHLIGRSRERPQWQGSQRYHGKLASRVEKNILGSCSDPEIHLNDVNQQGRLRCSQQQYKERRPGKQQLLSSEVTRKSVPKTRRSTEESSVFSAPKTLDQIKEEKKNAYENGDSFRKVRHSSGASSENFQGPKPLSKILEDKKRLVSVISG